MTLCFVIALFPLFAIASWGDSVTKEQFLQRMEQSKAYWSMSRNYEDLKDGQKKVCISTSATQNTQGHTDIVWLQQYKFDECS
uniref:Putative secreted protein n=1 Tax=Amblyomma parvum TaxID=251391 RepID=A0A023FTP5_AMBPA